MAIRRGTITNVSRPTGSGSIPQSSNTISHSSGSRSSTTSRSSVAIQSSSRMIPTNRNMSNNASTATSQPATSGAVNSTSTAKSSIVTTVNSSVSSAVNDTSRASANSSTVITAKPVIPSVVNNSAQLSVNNSAADSKGVLVSINAGNAIIHNDSGSVTVKPTAIVEAKPSVRHEAVDYSTIHTVPENEAKETLVQANTESTAVKKIFTDTSKVEVRNVTAQVGMGDKPPAHVENLGEEKKKSSLVRNRPVFTGESIYSINSKRTKNQNKAQPKNMSEYIQCFAQKKISSAVLLAFWDTLSKTSRISWSDRQNNNKYNKDAIDKMITKGKYKEGKVINNQAEWSNVKFGSSKNSNMAYAGCEIFATYNAMVKLGEKITGDGLADMITLFEKNGATLKGEWGTSPIAVYDYLKNKYKNDVNVKVSMYVPDKISVSNKKIDKIGDENDVFLATVYNNADKITDMIHTVCISKEDDGSYTVYNAYKKDKDGNYVAKEGYKSLSDAIDNISSNPQLISLIYIDEATVGDFPYIDQFEVTA